MPAFARLPIAGQRLAFAYAVSGALYCGQGGIGMPGATLTEKGQIVIPAEIRARHGLTPGTQLEFVDDDGTIRLVVRRRITPSDAAAGYGLVKLESRGKARRLADFDAARLLKAHGPLEEPA
jgi:AbrB family looped-hinge helix DNA binding protein